MIESDSGESNIEEVERKKKIVAETQWNCFFPFWYFLYFLIGIFVLEAVTCNRYFSLFVGWLVWLPGFWCFVLFFPFFFFCVWMLVCISVYLPLTLHVWFQQRSEEGTGLPRSCIIAILSQYTDTGNWTLILYKSNWAISLAPCRICFLTQIVHVVLQQIKGQDYLDTPC